MKQHYIQKINLENDLETFAKVIPENCDWSNVPKIEQMKDLDIDCIVLTVKDFAEMFTVISEGEV